MNIMAKYLIALSLACMAGLCRASTNEVQAAAERTYIELQAENEALRKENQMLRRELVRQRGGEPVIDLGKALEPKEVEGAAVNGKATDDGGYWLAIKSMKRHNSKCRYYKMGKGRPCKSDEGTPCKKCGG